MRSAGCWLARSGTAEPDSRPEHSDEDDEGDGRATSKPRLQGTPSWTFPSPAGAARTTPKGAAIAEMSTSCSPCGLRAVILYLTRAEHAVLVGHSLR
jgi:hypothetical protein